MYSLAYYRLHVYAFVCGHARQGKWKRKNIFSYKMGIFFSSNYNENRAGNIVSQSEFTFWSVVDRWIATPSVFP